MRVPVAERPAAPEEKLYPVGEASWSDLRQRLRAFVARRVPNAADADDIVQSVLLQMHRRIDQLRRGDRIDAWGYSIARRTVADHFRSPSRRRELPSGDSLDIEVLQAHDQWRASDDADARRGVASCLAPVLHSLPATDREAIVFADVEGHRLADAAAVFGISLSGMKSRVQRARTRMRQAILACCRVVFDGRGAAIGCAQRDASRPSRCREPAL
jgi:RNA polymerase sigma-70 factor (ECF subfamily)